MTFKKMMFAAALLASSSAAVAGLADLKTKSGGIAAPAAGMGQVVFFRPGSLMGAALGCTVHEGQPQIARLGSGKYYVVPMAPGKHEFSTRGEATDRLTVEVEEGETYFVRCNIGMGVVAGRANLSPSEEAEFAKKAKGLKLWAGPKDKAEEAKGE
jgi:hypothetical protein